METKIPIVSHPPDSRPKRHTNTSCEAVAMLSTPWSGFMTPVSLGTVQLVTGSRGKLTEALVHVKDVLLMPNGEFCTSCSNYCPSNEVTTVKR